VPIERDLGFEVFCRRMFSSNIATRLGIANKPQGAQARLAVGQNLGRVYDAIWCPLEQRVGNLVLASGYRTPALNRAIKGASPSSAHVLGLAVDVEAPDIGNLELARIAVDVVDDFDQIILEFHSPADPTSGWVHIGLAVTQGRGEVKRSVRVYDAKQKRRRVRYFPGLTEEA